MKIARFLCRKSRAASPTSGGPPLEAPFVYYRSEINGGGEAALGGNIGVSTRIVLGADRIELLRRGAGAVERGGLENRCPSYGGPRVRIPPSPPAAL